MINNIVAKYVNGKAYAIRVPQSIVEKYGLIEGREIPLPLLFHLVYTGKAEVYNERGEKILFEDLVKSINDVDVFSAFIVLHDLVKRGKKVSVGENNRELLLTDEKTKVYVLDEDSYISAEDLYIIVDKAIKQEYRLIIAVVDINGEITYYEVNKMDFPKIERR
ncbi:MAG: hypothetical protein QXL96_08780 [Ignisphaera sp.]